jgi:hypothetical protein
MNTEQDLMQRLAVSKKIMEKHSEIKRGDVRDITPMVEDYQAPNATYNLPGDVMVEQTQTPNYDPSQPLEKDRILKSKLPDEIKRLMIEQPIVQPNTMAGPTISNEIIEGAQRLMNKDKISDFPQTPKQKISESHTTSNVNMGDLKTMIRDVVRDTVRDVVREELQEAGMLIESTTNANEVIQFKVGNTVFVGKVTKVKKLK